MNLSTVPTANIHEPDIYGSCGIAQYRTTQAATGKSFQGSQLEVNIDVPASLVGFTPTLTFNTQLQVQTADAAGAAWGYAGALPAVGTSKPIAAVAPGGMLNAFNKVVVEVNTAVYANIDNWQQAYAAIRLATKPWGVMKNDPVRFNLDYLRKSSTTLYSAFPVDQNPGEIGGVLLSTRTLPFSKTWGTQNESVLNYIYDNSFKQGLTTKSTISLSEQLDILPLLQDIQKIHGACRVTLRFFSDANWRSKVVNAVVVSSAGGTGIVNISDTIAESSGYVESDGLAANRVLVSVQELFLYMDYCRLASRGISQGMLSIKNYNCVSHQVPTAVNSDDFLISVSLGTVKAIVFFQQPVIINAKQFNPVSSNNIGGLLDLNYIRCEWAAQEIPENDYNAYFLDGAAAEGDIVRAYNMYVMNQFQNSPEKAMSFDEFRHQPVFVFTLQSHAQRADNLHISLKFNAPTSGTNPITVYVLYTWEEEFFLHMDQHEVNMSDFRVKL